MMIAEFFGKETSTLCECGSDALLAHLGMHNEVIEADNTCANVQGDVPNLLAFVVRYEMPHTFGAHGFDAFINGVCLRVPFGMYVWVWGEGQGVWGCVFWGDMEMVERDGQAGLECGLNTPRGKVANEIGRARAVACGDGDGNGIAFARKKGEGFGELGVGIFFGDA